jgi:hypothetical protein
MIPAFAVAISIATHGNDHKLRVDYLGSGCSWQRSAVKDI